MIKAKRIIALAMSMLLLAVQLPVSQAQAAQFTDIRGHWAEESINRAVEMGLFDGTSPTKFSPNEPMTRAMVVTILAKKSGYNPNAYHTSKFTDVRRGDWFEPAVAWAVQQGIVSGTSDTTFSPNKAVTREQLAVIVVKYANYSAVILPRIREKKQFKDIDQCADYALDSIETLYRSGLVDGVNGTSFSPRGNVTRAQGAVILCSYIDHTERSYQASEKVCLVAHRGYSKEAPENTLPAYELAAKKGYLFAETDVQFTKDNVAVLLHDDTIDRTSNGTGAVSELTYAELQKRDFGAWKSNRYVATPIPTFDAFMKLCAEKGLHIYVELKCVMTEQQVASLIQTANKYGMGGKVSWISFSYNNLKLVTKCAPNASLMFLTSKVDMNFIHNAQRLRNGRNYVMVSLNAATLKPEQRAMCLKNGLEFGVWTVDDKDKVISQANTSAEFITTNSATYAQLYH